jgi:hypothetical protein
MTQPLDTLINKKRKFSSYIRKFRMGAVARSYMTNGLLIYDKIFAHFLIFLEALPHIRLCNDSVQNFLICI